MTTIGLEPRTLTPPELDSIAQARAAREAADQSARRALTATTAAVVMLHGNGWTMREIGRALGLSHQRVHQIVGARTQPMAPPGPEA